MLFEDYVLDSNQIMYWVNKTNCIVVKPSPDEYN